MAAASISNGDAGNAEFEFWLSGKLRSLNTDDSILVEYVRGILEGEDEDESEKREALMGILAEISTEDTEGLCQEIIKMWIAIKGLDSSLAALPSGAKGAKEEHDPHLEDKIAQIMLQQAESSVVRKTTSSNHNSDVKQAILAQYSEVCDVATDDEAEESGDEGAEGAAALIPGVLAKLGQPLQQAEKPKKEKGSLSSSDLLCRNTNAETVAKAEREKRERAKAEAEQKRQQDKLNREKQKQAAKDRDDKEKKRTQKGERRR